MRSMWRVDLEIIWLKRSRILLLLRYHSPYAAAGVLHVSLVARDEVDVDVVDRLARCAADVDPDVVALGMMLLVECILGLPEHSIDGQPLAGGKIKVTGHMTPRNHERVALGDGVLVEDGEDEVI